MVFVRMDGGCVGRRRGTYASAIVVKLLSSLT